MNRVKLRSRRDVGPGILAAVGLLLFLVPGAPLGTHAAQAPPPPAGRPHVDPAAEVVGSGMTPPRAPLIAGGWVNRTAQLGVAPSARFGAMSAYDAADGALLLFGGTGVGHQVLRDTWTYVDGVWHNITNLAGTAPSARTDGTMAYDSADAEVVLYGGIHLGTYQSDTWAFKGGQWSSVSTNTSAGPVADAAMSFDPTVEALVLFGGSPHPGTAVRNTTFTFAKGVWKNISSTVASTPPGVTRASMTWDGRLNATLLFGGTGPKQPINQTWAFSLGHWRRLTAPNDVAPPARDSAGFAYDAADGYDVLFGGNAAGFALNDTWAFRSGNWSLLPEGVIPPGRSLGALVYTPGPGPLNASIVLFGGRSSPLANATVDGDTWTYKLPLQATINLSAAMIDVSHTLTVGISVAGGYPPYAVNWTQLPTGCAGPTSTQSFPCVPQVVGSVAVSAVVGDSGGSGVNATSANVTVEPLPTVSVSALNTSGPATLYVHFVVTLTGGTAPFSYVWNFGNGFMNSSGSPSRSFVRPYSKQGEYAASLSVTDADGALTSSTPILVNVTAMLSVFASASVLYGWAPLVVAFSSQVSGGMAPYTYAWNLGEGGGIYSQPAPRTTYPTPGVYHVILKVTDALDKNASSALNITVVAPLSATFLSTFPGGPVCHGAIATAVLQLTAQPIGGSAPYNDSWSVNGTATYGTTPPSQAFPGGTLVPVNLTVTDARGNRTSSAHTVLVPTTSCGTVVAPSAGVSTATLELYAALAIGVLIVIAVEAGILLRGRRSRGGGG